MKSSSRKSVVHNRQAGDEAANDGDGSHENGEHDLAGAECLLDFVVHRCDVRVLNGAMGVGHWSTILIRGGILPVGI